MTTEAGSRRYGAILHLPPRGTLVASTDLHGNLPDFETLEQRFRTLMSTEGDAYLLFCGDLIHGPIYSRKQWPRRLGTYYPDQSAEVIERFTALREEFPGRIFSLLGNHEHSHLGGPHTRKFHKVPSETEFFEQTVGAARADEIRLLLATFPIVCVAGRGLVFTHGAPRVLSADMDEVASVRYTSVSCKKIHEMYQMPVLGELLWCRQAGPLVIRRFLRRMEVDGQRNGVVLYGHDPVSNGFDIRSSEQICFSTSFALKNKMKVYVELDLAREFRSAYDLRPGLELRHLYPDEADESSPLMAGIRAGSSD